MAPETPAAPEAAELVEEASAATNGDGPAEDVVHETSPAEERTHTDLFEFSRYLHVGPGAETCPEGENGSCNDNMHFHAWLRLPNQFQHASIREKANAAKARRIRQLRDPESDVRTILDSEVDQLIAAENKEALVEELVGKDFVRDYMSAVEEVKENEEEGEKFKTIDEDRTRFQALRSLPADERPAEEYEELEKHITDFTELVRVAYEAIQKPLRDSLDERSLDELGEMLREDRIDREGDREFNDTYQHWEWYIGTLRPRDPAKGMPVDRYWGHIDHMRAAAREVLEAVGDAFNSMEAAIGNKLKNS